MQELPDGFLHRFHFNKDPVFDVRFTKGHALAEPPEQQPVMCQTRFNGISVVELAVSWQACTRAEKADDGGPKATVLKHLVFSHFFFFI